MWMTVLSAQRVKSSGYANMCGPECITHGRKIRHEHIRNCGSDEHKVKGLDWRFDNIDLSAIEKLRS